MIRVIKGLSLGVLTLFLAGCVNYQINMSINEDKSVNLKMLVDVNIYDYMEAMLTEGGMWELIQEQEIQENCAATCPYEEGTSEYTQWVNTCLEENEANITEDPTDEDIRNYIESSMAEGSFSEEESISAEDKERLENMGFSVNSSFDEENYIYQASITKDFPNIDTISTSDDFTLNLLDIFNEEGNNYFFVKTSDNSYKASYIFEDTTSDSDSSDLNIDMNNFMSFEYQVTLPNAPLSHNADSISEDQKTLTWNLLNRTDGINFEFSFGDSSWSLFDLDNDTLRLLAIGLIGAGSLGLIITVVVFNSKKKRK